MGLIEQVIIPSCSASEIPNHASGPSMRPTRLGALGQTMRASLLRSALRRHMGG